MEESAEHMRRRLAADALFRKSWETQIERHGTPTCTVCSGQDWFFYAALMLPTGYLGIRVPIEQAEDVDVAQFACKRCGNLLHFDAFTLIGDALPPAPAQ